MTGVSDQEPTGHPDNTQARNTLEENTMQRRNITLGDRIIQQLAQFAVDELGLGDDVENILNLEYFDGSQPTGDTLVALWDLIQANDPEPSADIADYIGDPVLGQAARDRLVEVGLR